MKKGNHKKISKRIVIIIGLFFCNHFASAEALGLPKDNEGWTIFTPSNDSRIMYVSADGNNDTGQVYDNNDPVLGEDPFNPTGPINSFATYAAAYINMRDGYPDWILFKRGDVFYDTVGQLSKSGRSIHEPLLIGAYGSSGLSPLLKVGSGRGIYVAESAPFGYLAVQGIRFYAHTRNPDDPEYDSTDNGASGMELTGSFVSNILIEGCAFMYTRGNTVRASYDVGRIKDIDFRRNLFLHNYQIETSHSMGLYGEYTENTLLEENIFDHNGWLIQSIPSEERPEGWNEQTGGQATIRNHNTYFSAAKGFKFINNISMRPSSIHNKHASARAQPNTIVVEDVLHDNNLYIDGEAILDAVGNNPERGVRGNQAVFSNNVAYKIGLSRPTRRELSWGVGVSGLGDAGRSAIFNNIILNGLPGGFDAVGISLGGSNPIVEGEVGIYNLDIYNNILYGNTESSGGASFKGISVNRMGENCTIRDNYIRTFIESSYFIDSALTLESWSLSGNQYYRAGGGASRVAGVVNVQEQWQLSHEPTAIFTEKTFSDDTRTVETYLASIGKIPTLDEFIELSRAQDRYNWDARIMASEVNSYIRAGFDMEPINSSFRADVDGSSQINTTDALLTLRSSLGLSMTGTAWRVSATTGDVNCDGVSNSTDALLILRHSLGLSMSGTTWCE